MKSTKTNQMNLWPIYSLLGVLFVLLVVGVSFYFFFQDYQLTQLESDKLALASEEGVEVADESNSWRAIYPKTQAMKIADVEVEASVADSMSERITGLSNTPYLPETLVKLFVFDSPGLHSIWMKDMNYALDIIWIDESETIIHIEEAVTPESFPDFFTPVTPAKYVIEANAGFVSKNSIELGQIVVLPNL